MPEKPAIITKTTAKEGMPPIWLATSIAIALVIDFGIAERVTSLENPNHIKKDKIDTIFTIIPVKMQEIIILKLY